MIASILIINNIFSSFTIKKAWKIAFDLNILGDWNNNIYESNCRFLADLLSHFLKKITKYIIFWFLFLLSRAISQTCWLIFLWKLLYGGIFGKNYLFIVIEILVDATSHFLCDSFWILTSIFSIKFIFLIFLNLFLGFFLSFAFDIFTLLILIDHYLWCIFWCCTTLLPHFLRLSNIIIFS